MVLLFKHPHVAGGALLLLAALVVAGEAWSVSARRPAPAAPPLDEWDVTQLVCELDARGVRLNAVATARDGIVSRSAFLTSGEQSWKKLNVLTLAPERIEDWNGVVYCEKPRDADARDLRASSWGECGLRQGPFVFFGDRELLERIRAALATGQV